MLTHTKLGVAKITMILICYIVWIMKNATYTMKPALAERALMGTVGEAH
jgi:hypothetical protein